MMINKLFALIIFLFSLSLSAQKDALGSLGGNSILIHHKDLNTKVEQTQVMTPMVLPFYDDFSVGGPYPNPARWLYPQSKSVFINHGFPIAPPSIGVATFDGLNAGGYPYCISCTTGSNNSDSLVSAPVRLDSVPNVQKLHLSDSIFFSFYYQAKGYGDSPETGDELMLYFRDSGNTKQPWPIVPVWSQAGYNPNFTFPHDTAFRRVIIAISDTLHLTSQFQFMFVNKSTQCGSIDHWHIDQVYLNKGRRIHDSAFNDASVVYDQHSLLKNYSQMPWRQFSGGADMTDSIHAVFRNNDSISLNLTTFYSLKDKVGNYVISPITLGANNVPNYATGGYCKINSMISAPLTYTYNGGAPYTDSISYTLRYYLQNLGGDINHGNDTAYFQQKFDNYFAYDDGTAERGYGAGSCTQCTQSAIAVKYKLNKPDTLRALDIYFDPIIDVNYLQNSNIQLLVWDDNNGVPGNILVRDSLSYPFPVYSQTGTDIFQRYQLSRSHVFTTASTFYVGVYELLNYSLNIGYDLNTNSRKNVFYLLNDGSGWHNSSFNGSLMIHPVFGDSLRALLVKNYTRPGTKYTVYPNPASDYIRVGSPDDVDRIMITDLSGRIILEEKNLGEQISVAELTTGVYVLRSYSTRGGASVFKLVITR